VKTILKHIRAVFEFYVNKATPPIKHNPCRGIKAWGKVTEGDAKEIPKMTREEIRKLLAYTLESKSDWYLIFLTAYLTGMRSGELWGLKWTDIDEKFESITVKRSYCFHSKKEKPPKNGLVRRVPIHPKLKSAFQAEKLKSDSSYVLTHHPLWADGKIATQLKKFQKELKITQTSFHSIRASCITHLLLDGATQTAVMALAGHASFKTTEFYVLEVQREQGLENLTNSLLSDEAGTVIPIPKRKRSNL